LRAPELRLASASESDTLAALGGDGTTGDLIGIITTSVSTTTTTSPIAGFSPIATTSITAADFMVGDFMVALPAGEVSARRSVDSRHHTPSQVHIPAHSAASITEEPPEAFPHAASRASVEASMEAEAFTVSRRRAPGVRFHYFKNKS